jgi:hypothetical protein
MRKRCAERVPEHGGNIKSGMTLADFVPFQKPVDFYVSISIVLTSIHKIMAVNPAPTKRRLSIE